MDNDDFPNEQTFLQAMNILPVGTIKLVHHHTTKDLIVLLSFLISTIGILVAFVQYRYSRFNQQIILKDMVSLQKAEDQIHELQRELDKVKMEASTGASSPLPSNAVTNTDLYHHHLNRQEGNHNLTDELSKNDQGIQEDSNDLFNYHNQLTTTVADSAVDYSRINELEEELRQTREQLIRAETALTNKSWAPPHQLQLWLQLTHELELNHYIAKRQSAENQLAAAKEGCEKLKKKRSSFFGSLRVAHGSSIDDVDNRILQAKQALSEITKELKERLNRWQQIEFLCGFPIIHNRGIVQIQAEIFNTNNHSKNLPPPIELHRSTSEAYIIDTESETLTLSKSPGISRYRFNQRSLRSSHSSDHKSSFSTSSSTGHHQQHYHQSNQKSHHIQHNYLHSQLSRTEPNNGLTDTNYLNESTADESSGSDLDIASSTSHRHLNHAHPYQSQYYNSYQSHLPPPPPPPPPPPSNYNHDKVIFTLGDGVLDKESNLTEDASFQPHHRRTWSSIRRAPRRSKRGKETKNDEISKTESTVDQQSQDGRRIHSDNHQPRKSSPHHVSYGDTTEIREAVKQDTQIEPSSTTDEDEIEKSTDPSSKIIENNGKDHNSSDLGENGITPPSPSTPSSHGKHHSISTYIREARRSFKFMNHKRKRSSTDSKSKSTPDNQIVANKNQVD